MRRMYKEYFGSEPPDLKAASVPMELGEFENCLFPQGQFTLMGCRVLGFSPPNGSWGKRRLDPISLGPLKRAWREEFAQELWAVHL